MCSVPRYRRRHPPRIPLAEDVRLGARQGAPRHGESAPARSVARPRWVHRQAYQNPASSNAGSSGLANHTTGILAPTRCGWTQNQPPRVEDRRLRLRPSPAARASGIPVNHISLWSTGIPDATGGKRRRGRRCGWDARARASTGPAAGAVGPRNGWAWCAGSGTTTKFAMRDPCEVPGRDVRVRWRQRVARLVLKRADGFQSAGRTPPDLALSPATSPARSWRPAKTCHAALTGTTVNRLVIRLIV